MCISLLLSLTHKCLQDFVYMNTNIIISKEYIIKEMEDALVLDENSNVEIICDMTVIRLPKLKIDMDDRI